MVSRLAPDALLILNLLRCHALPLAAGASTAPVLPLAAMRRRPPCAGMGRREEGIHWKEKSVRCRLFPAGPSLPPAAPPSSPRRLLLRLLALSRWRSGEMGWSGTGERGMGVGRWHLLVISSKMCGQSCNAIGVGVEERQKCRSSPVVHFPGAIRCAPLLFRTNLDCLDGLQL